MAKWRGMAHSAVHQVGEWDSLTIEERVHAMSELRVWVREGETLTRNFDELTQCAQRMVRSRSLPHFVAGVPASDVVSLLFPPSFPLTPFLHLYRRP